MLLIVLPDARPPSFLYENMWRKDYDLNENVPEYYHTYSAAAESVVCLDGYDSPKINFSRLNVCYFSKRNTVHMVLTHKMSLSFAYHSYCSK